LARAHTRFVCQQCGASYPKWAGRCEACGGWNSLVEETTQSASPRGLGGGKGKKLEVVGLAGSSAPLQRRITGISELDRVCGGGLVPGSALLVGGDPGIGKSTLLLQAMAALAAPRNGRSTATCLYISGEESLDQIRLRALRLDVAQRPVQLAAATSVRDIAASLDQRGGPDVVVVDSIQTLYLDSLDSAPGTVSQVRASAHELIRLAKSPRRAPSRAHGCSSTWSTPCSTSRASAVTSSGS
jgi:DNA repair protein RadA/Sms